MDVLKVERIKEVLPPNYAADMKRLKDLERQNHKLKNMVACGNISTLEELIDQFTAYARLQLKKISLEVQFTEYGNIEYALIQEFMNYLLHIKEELGALVSFTDEINVENSSIISEEILIEMEEIKKKLCAIGKASLSEGKLKELFFTLQSFNEILGHFGQAEKEDDNHG